MSSKKYTALRRCPFCYKQTEVEISFSNHHVKMTCHECDGVTVFDRLYKYVD